jgi:dipeptidyl aminopeptidase/acylaminoacyl peptidase
MTVETHPRWIARFMAPVVGFPTWNRHAPDRLVVSSTESGRWQLWGWDPSTGTRQQVSDEPVGVEEGHMTGDGNGVAWLSDETGAEAGRYVVAPFSGGPPGPVAADLPSGWGEGLALGRRVSVAGISDERGFAIHRVDPTGEVRTLHRHRESVRPAGEGMSAGSNEQAALSADERYVALEHSEHGDMIHPALRVIESESGRTVAELRDDGQSVGAYAWSPVPGDPRLAITHERQGELRPAIWDVESGKVTDLALDLEGLVVPADWWPDASSLLLVQLVDGRGRLHRYEIETGRLEPLPVPEGSVSGARVRPDGKVWYLLSSGAAPPRVREVGREEPLFEPDGPAAPEGRPFESWSFQNPHGQRVHGFVVHPDGEAGPHPVLMFVHGGPTWLDLDRWSPEVQAYTDAGFLVAMVNYRGSVGYGREWRDTLIGNIGWPEVEDVLAGLDDLVARGLADPERAVIGGWSWGGFVTLLMHGMHPDRFRAGVAGVPVGDYAAGYEDLSPTLQAYDRALLGGTPAEVPTLMAERSPISYVDRVMSPILFLAGRNDSRCPLGQVLRYTDRLKARRHPHELYIYDVGHSSYDIDERLRQLALILDFLARQVPGIERLPGVDERKPTSDVEVVGTESPQEARSR